MRGIGNIIIGGIMVVGGLTGNLSLRGTNSGPALAAVGGILIVIGLVRMLKSREE